MPTQASYMPTKSQVGLYLRIRATYTDGEGSDKTAEAEPDSVVSQPSAPNITVSTFVSGLNIPWGITFTPDETMLIAERRGKLRSRLTDGTVQTVSADFSDLFVAFESGLMGIVVDPDFASNRRFYTCQAHTGPEVQVIAWTMNDAYTAATRVADPLIGGIPADFGQHAGCRLRFGPQGYLWVTTGDAFIKTTPQELSSLGGKVLRVDASTGAGAPGNPFPSSPRIYTYGHRNPQGLALRPDTSQMWLVEHGPQRDDEINLLTAGGNYGWNGSGLMTDLEKFPAAIEAKWSSGSPTLATSGGIFLEGEDWGEWDGRLAVATLKNSSLHIFEFAADGTLVSHVVPSKLKGRYRRLRTPMLGPDGALYVTTSNGYANVNVDRILRVVPGRPPQFPSETARQEVAENTAPLTLVATVTATDSDGTPLTYTLSGSDAAAFAIDASGQITLGAETVLDYETRQTYTLIVTATDQYGLSSRTTLTLAVTDVNEPVVAQDDAFVLAEDTAPSLDVLANDHDPEGVSLLPAITAHPGNGMATVQTGTGRITYTPTAHFTGPDAFTYTVTDGTHSATATVSLTVTPVNDAPVFLATESGARSVPENTGDRERPGQSGAGYRRGRPYADLPPGRSRCRRVYPRSVHRPVTDTGGAGPRDPGQPTGWMCWSTTARMPLATPTRAVTPGSA